MSTSPALRKAWLAFCTAHEEWMRTLIAGSTRKNQERQETAWQAFTKERRTFKRMLDEERG